MRGVVHYHHVAVFQILAYESLIKLLRRVGLGLYGFAIGCAKRPGKLLGRCAKADGQYAVYGAEHLRLALFDVGCFGAFGHHFAQFEAVFAEAQLDERRPGLHRIL